MMLSKPLQKTFLYSIDTLGQVIDENPVSPLLHAIYLPSAAHGAPLGTLEVGRRNYG